MLLLLGRLQCLAVRVGSAVQVVDVEHARETGKGKALECLGHRVGDGSLLDAATRRARAAARAARKQPGPRTVHTEKVSTKSNKPPRTMVREWQQPAKLHEGAREQGKEKGEGRVCCAHDKRTSSARGRTGEDSPVFGLLLGKLVVEILQVVLVLDTRPIGRGESFVVQLLPADASKELLLAHLVFR